VTPCLAFDRDRIHDQHHPVDRNPFWRVAYVALRVADLLRDGRKCMERIFSTIQPPLMMFHVRQKSQRAMKKAA